MVVLLIAQATTARVDPLGTWATLGRACGTRSVAVAFRGESMDDPIYDLRDALALLGVILGGLCAAVFVLALFNQRRVDWWVQSIYFSAAVVSVLVAAMCTVVRFGGRR